MKPELIKRIIENGGYPNPPDLYERYVIYMHDRFPWLREGPVPEPDPETPMGRMLIAASNEWFAGLPEADRKRAIEHSQRAAEHWLKAN
jgi:hypothetical protein